MEIKLEQRRSNIGSFYIDHHGDRPGQMDLLTKDGVMNIYHTELSEQLQGEHTGDKLMEVSVNFALKII
ncbi:MAG: N-acetyltransferase [Mucilaginibacter sp.]|nr:N-acetyltransferase [Mucilaginibacter sp.]